MNDKNLFWVAVIVIVLLVGVFFAGPVFINKVTDKVIDKVRSQYSPSPYGPGFDPDKIDTDALRKPKN